MLGRYRAVVPGVPVPWHPVVHRKGKHSSIAASPESLAYQALVGRCCWLAVRSVGGERVLGACEVVATLVFPRPRHARGDHAGRPAGRYPHHVAPDVDKVARNVLDGLQLYSVLGRAPGRGVIEDDARVAALTLRAWYAAEGELPHAVIEWGALGCKQP